jgi:selT/selW/selH-like putative selenoprotein
LEAEVTDAFANVEVRLVESSGGAFEVSVDGDLVFSKLTLGRHANPGEVVGLIRERLA